MASFRGILAVVAGIAAFFFVFWVGGALIYGIGLPWALAFPLGGYAAYRAGKAVMTGSSAVSDGLLSSSMKWALIVGAASFCAGFFGPIIFAPEANQGPLLGIFITGPIGFLVGGVGGAILWSRRAPRRAR